MLACYSVLFLFLQFFLRFLFQIKLSALCPSKPWNSWFLYLSNLFASFYLMASFLLFRHMAGLFKILYWVLCFAVSDLLLHSHGFFAISFWLSAHSLGLNLSKTRGIPPLLPILLSEFSSYSVSVVSSYSVSVVSVFLPCIQASWQAVLGLRWGRSTVCCCVQHPPPTHSSQLYLRAAHAWKLSGTVKLQFAQVPACNVMAN